MDGAIIIIFGYNLSDYHHLLIKNSYLDQHNRPINGIQYRLWSGKSLLKMS